MTTNTRLSAVRCFLTVLTAFSLAGCFPGGENYSPSDPAGFFSGIWHGWIAPLSLIVGFFSDGVTLYETNNTGWWYDLGFYMAVISGFGGVALSRKSGKEKHRR
jgi:hypothetical protein